MVKSIPKFRFQVSEGIYISDQDPDRLFGYCIESTKGKLYTPEYIASNEELIRKYGISMAPHFYQNPTGVVISRVAPEGVSKPTITYESSDTNVELMTIESADYTTQEIRVVVSPSISVGGGFNLTIDIPNVVTKSYQSIPNILSVVKRINNYYGDYLKATFISEPPTGETILDDPNLGVLQGGSNGKLYDATTGAITTIDVDDGKAVPDGKAGGDSVNAKFTSMQIYRQGFESLKEVELIGVATLSNLDVVRNELVEHIEYMNTPEVAQLRTGVTAYLDYGVVDEIRNIDTLTSPPATIDNEYIMYIGQGMLFKEKDVERELPPHECVQLYTGLRSSLTYDQAIYAGLPNRVLKGCIKPLPLFNTGENIEIEDVEMLNESGVMTFKREYGENRFVEGVTTKQGTSVLSDEAIMSIVINASKRLIRKARPYQGQNLTRDLKGAMETDLNQELQNMIDTDGVLVPIEEVNPAIPAYKVDISAAALIRIDDNGETVRESKIIAKATIVPVNSLRDIDLGVIVI